MPADAIGAAGPVRKIAAEQRALRGGLALDWLAAQQPDQSMIRTTPNSWPSLMSQLHGLGTR